MLFQVITEVLCRLLLRFKYYFGFLRDDVGNEIEILHSFEAWKH